MVTKAKKKSAEPPPWRYPGAGRPKYFDQPGRDFTPAQRDFVTRFFYLPYASQVPGLVSGGEKVEDDDDADSRKNPNFLFVCRVAANIMWHRDVDHVQDAVSQNAKKTLAIVFRTFNPVKGSFENYFMYIFRRLIKRWAKADWKRRVRRKEVALDLAESMPPTLQGNDRYAVFAPNQKNGRPLLDPAADGLETALSLLVVSESRQDRPRRVRYILDHLTGKQTASLHRIIRGFKSLRATMPEAEWSDLAEMFAGGAVWTAMTDLQRRQATDNLRQESSRLNRCLVRWSGEFDRNQEALRDGSRAPSNS